MPLDASIISNLENQCKTLSEGGEKQVIIRQISNDLYLQMQGIVKSNGCNIKWDKETNKITIIKKEESDDDLDALADELKIGEKISFSVKKEYKVNKISEVKEICADAAADIDGGKYLVVLPTTLYERYRNEIIKEFPDSEGCTFVVATRETKTSSKTNVIYTSAFGDTDASDIVKAKEREVKAKEREVKAKEREVKAKEREVEQLEKMTKAEGYLGDLQKKVILMGNNINNKNLIIQTLDNILNTLKIGNLKNNKYGKNIKKVLVLIKTIHKSDSVIVKKIDLLLQRLDLK